MAAKTRRNFYVDDELYERLREVADDTERSMSDHLDEALRTHLEAYDETIPRKRRVRRS